MDKNLAFQTLEKLSFERPSGTEKELEAALFIKEEVEKIGVEVHLEDFTIPSPTIHKVKLVMTKPYYKEFHCTGQGFSGNTSEEGITAPVKFIHNGEEEYTLDIKGKIVITSGRINYELRQKLVDKGAIGYISTWGGFFDDEIMKTQVPHRSANVLDGDTNNFPGVLMNLYTCEQLLKCHPEEMNLVLIQDSTTTGKSQNVVATIPGKSIPQEQIVFTAHYDSVEFSSGAWDNATGSITILELCRYFAKHQPERTMKFVWCGCEEIGLNGSYEYCKAHKDELEQMILNINYDMTGVLMGTNRVFGSCDPKLVERCVYLGKVNGIPFTSAVGLPSTDSTSFAVHGVPGISFGTNATLGGATIHSRRDTIDHLDPDAFIEICEFSAKFAEEIANAKVNVVPRALPKETTEPMDSMKKRLGFKD